MLSAVIASDGSMRSWVSP